MALDPRPARCWNCKGKYSKRRSWAKFCSDACRKEYNRNTGVPAWRIENSIRRLLKEKFSRDVDDMRAAAKQFAELRALLLEFASWIDIPAEERERLNLPKV